MRHNAPHPRRRKPNIARAVFMIGIFGNTVEKCTTALSIRETPCQSGERLESHAPDRISGNSGLLFHLSQPHVPLARTLPVRLFFWALSGFALFFALGWYLDGYYVPLLWRNLPH
jgi:hypothetical protein